LAEQPEEFFLNLSAPTGGARIAASQATAVIASDDGGGQLRFFFAPDALFVTEANGTVSVPVERLNGWTGTVSVHYETLSGTATAGADFAAASGTLTWADGDTNFKVIDVEFFDDNDPEILESLQIRLSQATGGVTIGTRDQELAIEDNDPGLLLARTGVTIGESAGSVVISVVRSGAPVGAVSVDYATSSGTATAGTDFTSANGTLNWADGDSADKTIAVNVANDSTDESDEAFTLTLSNPSAGAILGSNSTATVTITDDDVPSGGGGSSSGGGGGGGGAFDWFDALCLTLLLFARASALRAH
ncbi:MAG: Calx-beta domain-containing protein, partial [bacterium]